MSAAAQERQAGVYYDLPAEDYHRGEGVSASILKRMLSATPYKVRYELDHPKPDSESQKIGSIAHAAILEANRLERDYTVAEKPDLRRKGAKEAWAETLREIEAAGQEVVTLDQYDLARRLRDAVWSHPTAQRLLSSGHPEVSLYAEHEGLLLRSREDWMSDRFDIIADVKTTYSIAQFQRTVVNYDYDLSAHHYRLVRQAVRGTWPDYLWIVVESEPPHEVVLYQPDEWIEARGAQRWERAFAIARECITSDQWPSYDQTVQPISLPGWARRQLEYEGAL